MTIYNKALTLLVIQSALLLASEAPGSILHRLRFLTSTNAAAYSMQSVPQRVQRFPCLPACGCSDVCAGVLRIRGGASSEGGSSPDKVRSKGMAAGKEEPASSGTQIGKKRSKRERDASHASPRQDGDSSMRGRTDMSHMNGSARSGADGIDANRVGKKRGSIGTNAQPRRNIISFQRQKNDDAHSQQVRANNAHGTKTGARSNFFSVSAEEFRATVHGGKHTTLPSTWMQPTENGQGPRIIELSNEPALPAITINTADAYLDTDSEEYAVRDGKMMANPQGKVQKKKKKQKEEHTGSTSEISGSYSEANEDEETSEGDGGKEERADRGQAKRTNETRPHDSLLSVRPGLAHTVFVGGLNFSTTERHLTAAFGGPEVVASVRMPRRRDGRRRGLGFVEMKSRKLAQAALQKHGMLLMSRRINVRPALQDADKESLVAARKGIIRVRPPGCRAVFVGNLAWPDEARLRHHFAACGNITELTFFVDRETGEFKRSARLSFNSITAAEAAMNLHASMIQGMPQKPIRVTYAVTDQDIRKAAFRKGSPTDDRTEGAKGKTGRRGGSPMRAGKQKWRQRRDSIRSGSVDQNPEGDGLGGAAAEAVGTRGAGAADEDDEQDSRDAGGGGRGKRETGKRGAAKGGKGGKVGKEHKRRKRGSEARAADAQEKEWGARGVQEGNDQEEDSVLAFSSDANAEQILEGLKRKQEEKEKELDSSEHAMALMAELDYQLQHTARALKAKGIKADPQRLRRLILADENPDASDADLNSVEETREPSPTAWRTHGDRRYPVYPGYEKLDPLKGPSGRQRFINMEGVHYNFKEGEPRLWPRSAINDTSPVGYRWVDQNIYPENFGNDAPWKRQEGDPDSYEND